MIFPFVRYRVEPSLAIPSGIIARPEIPIRIATAVGFLEALGLIDTGADQVFLPAFLADALGIELEHAETESAVGAGGHELRTWAGEVTLGILEETGQVRSWAVQVGFMDTDDNLAPALLGHAGFLEYFTATFHGDDQTVELIPNGRLPQN